MRECPNCSEQIQDDAVFCRHCHTELEPPLWLTSMRKCPYCAEWVDIKLERCNHCDRPLTSTSTEHTAPFIESSDEPEDFSQTLRENLLTEDSEEAAAIAAAAAEFVAEEPDDSLADLEPADTPYLDELRNYEESREQAKEEAEAASAAAFEATADEPDPPSYEQPQSDLRRSLYESEYEDDASVLPDDEGEPPEVGGADYEPALEPEPEPSEYQADPYSEPSSYEPVSDDPSEYIEPPLPATDSGIWMAGAADEEQEYLGASGPRDSDDRFGRSAAGTEGVSDLREGVSGPPGRFRRSIGKVVRTVILIAGLGAAAYGLYVVSQGPVGAAITEALATDIPTETPIPSPTATLRPAPTLPPEFTAVPTEGAGGLPTGVPTELAGCVPWDAITLEHEGTELCAYGIIKRWWAGEEIPFIAIFSEEEGTFAIIDRTTRYPVGPGSCITATGIVEVMGGTRPNIDAQGALEDCPAGVGDA